MVNFYRNVIIKLEQDLSDLISENIDTIKVSELIINLILTQVSQLKQFVTEKGFKNIDEEIYFFKQLKPNIISKLIYYNAIYKIETKKPNDTKALKKYYSDKTTNSSIDRQNSQKPIPFFLKSLHNKVPNLLTKLHSRLPIIIKLCQHHRIQALTFSGKTGRIMFAMRQLASFAG